LNTGRRLSRGYAGRVLLRSIWESLFGSRIGAEGSAGSTGEFYPVVIDDVVTI